MPALPPLLAAILAGAAALLRLNPGAVWSLLRREKDLVITSNGKPIGVLTVAEEDSLEEVLATLRRGRAEAAVAHLRASAVRRGLDKLHDDEIEKIVRKTRLERRRRTAAALGLSIVLDTNVVVSALLRPLRASR